ncbi:ankyrin repeat domain-containing protein [Candidatus Gracilibacteria bacterium]|nr:ankyrin repeat domain-containing protein [Candidatus Gracilibacteria bacterium]
MTESNFLFSLSTEELEGLKKLSSKKGQKVSQGDCGRVHDHVSSVKSDVGKTLKIKKSEQNESLNKVPKLKGKKNIGEPSIEEIVKAIRGCNYGVLKVFANLIKKSKNVNIQHENQNTALIWASWFGSEEIVALLLKRKDIDVNIINGNGETAYVYALLRGEIEIAKMIKKHPSFDPKLNGL